MYCQRKNPIQRSYAQQQFEGDKEVWAEPPRGYKGIITWSELYGAGIEEKKMIVAALISRGRYFVGIRFV